MAAAVLLCVHVLRLAIHALLLLLRLSVTNARVDPLDQISRSFVSRPPTFCRASIRMYESLPLCQEISSHVLALEWTS
jgi:hypothetical protein